MNFKVLEGRSRDNNTDIVGRQEGEEKDRPTEFITGIIPGAVWGPATSPSPVVVDGGGGWWWWWMVVAPPEPSDRPWSIITRIYFPLGQRNDSTAESATTGELQRQPGLCLSSRLYC